MAAPSLAAARHATPNGGIDGFSPRRREDDLTRSRTEERRHLLASALECNPRRASFDVQPAGIGVVLAQERKHRLERDRPQW